MRDKELGGKKKDERTSRRSRKPNKRIEFSHNGITEGMNCPCDQFACCDSNHLWGDTEGEKKEKRKKKI